MTYDGSGDPAEDQVVRDLTAGIPGGLYGSISAGSYADDTRGLFLGGMLVGFFIIRYWKKHNIMY